MSKCPFCFQNLSPSQITFRCTSGDCSIKEQRYATEKRGYTVETTPIVAAMRSDGKLPSFFPCMECLQDTKQEVCPHCLYDIPDGWRGAQVFTTTVVGATGTGKTIYTAVMVEVLKGYVQRAARQCTSANKLTKELYEAEYYTPLFVENRVVDGTKELSMEGALQRDALIWRISPGAGADSGEFFLVIRDCAGEDFQSATEYDPDPALTYVADADLVIFMFDPMVLKNVMNILPGLIPNIDKTKLGFRAEEVFPNLVAHVGKGKGDLALALTVAKFDSLHQLPKANTAYASTMGNPAAHFNRDDTMRRRVGPYNRTGEGSQAEAKDAFLEDINFLDGEIRSLLAQLGAPEMTKQADAAVTDKKFTAVRHFAVSALGTTPQHEKKLTERGISPFRVLDPVLWGLARQGIWV